MSGQPANELAVDFPRNYYNQVRYTAKAFLARYPLAPLRIFSQPPGKYIFWVGDPHYASPSHCAEFNHEIRPATAPIVLTADAIPDGAVEIDLAATSQVPHEIEEIHTLESLTDSLTSRHPKLSPLHIEQDTDLALTIYVPTSAAGQDLSSLRSDVKRLPIKLAKVNIEYGDAAGVRSLAENVFYIRHSSRRTPSIRDLPHIRRDEEYWRGEFEKAARGMLPRDIEEFSFTSKPGVRSVFVPALELPGIPDLRNYFLLYDVVLLEAPLLDQYGPLESATRLTERDFIEAARRGRLRVIITQPEERLPIPLLEKIEAEAPHAVIGRRASTCFAIARLAQDKLSFESLFDESKEMLRSFAGQLAQHTGVSRDVVERTFSLPIARYYDALTRIRFNDLKCIDLHLGDTVWALTQAVLRNRQLPNLALEFRTGGQWTTISSLFDAELAISGTPDPFGFPANATSLFSSFLPTAGGAESGRVAGVSPRIFEYPEGPLFSFSRTRPLEQLLEAIGSGDETQIARTIFNDLAGLPVDQRRDRITQINDVVAQYGGVRTKRKIGSGTQVGVAHLLAQLGVSIAGALFAPVSWAQTLYQMAKGSGGIWRDRELINSLGDDFETKERQVQLLQRVRRIAWLSEE
jgi:hypothetical protein